MKIYSVSTLILVLTLVLNIKEVYSQTNGSKILANEIVQIKGTVRALANDKKKLLPVATISIIFQRVGCKKCLVATRTNLSGEYEIFVGRGKYKVIVYHFNAEHRLYDVVSPEQNRYINAQDNYRANKFDILLTFPQSEDEEEPIVIEPN